MEDQLFEAKALVQTLRDKVANNRAKDNAPKLFHLQSALENALSELIEAQTILREPNY
jgi:hypothetical protein